MGEIAEALKRATPESPPDAPAAEERPREVAAALARAESAAAEDEAEPGPQASVINEAEAPQPSASPALPRESGFADPASNTPTQVESLDIDEALLASSPHFARIAFRLRDLAQARRASSIAILSAEPSEGKTTTACNLAAALVKLDRSARILLVDLDLRRASMGPALDVRFAVGVEEVLRGEIGLDRAIMESSLPGLSLLGLRQPVRDAAYLLALPAFEEAIRSLESRFDYVLIDTPPVLAASDAQMILRVAAAGIFVVRAGQSGARAVARSLEHLPPGKILGTILNEAKVHFGVDHYYEYEYGETAGSGMNDPSDLDPASPEVPVEATER